MFKFLMSNRREKIQCELEVKRAELKSLMAHVKPDSYFFENESDKLDFLGWGDICNTCKEYEPFIHTHNFKHIEKAKCVRCSSDKINQMSQIFGTVMDAHTLIWSINTTLFCTSCVNKFDHRHRFSPVLIKEVRKINESKSLY